jgi:integrase
MPTPNALREQVRKEVLLTHRLQHHDDRSLHHQRNADCDACRLFPHSALNEACSFCCAKAFPVSAKLSSAKVTRASVVDLALDLLVYTGGRREGAVWLGPQHVRNNRVRFRQAKNEHRTPIDMDIPLHPELETSIAATQSGHLTFLVTEFGRPFTSAGFGNWFRDQCDKANLHHCSAHGLRKATAAALAEAGASTHEIAAVTGHMSLEEIERYTRAARKKKLADAAMAKLK